MEWPSTGFAFEDLVISSVYFRGFKQFTLAPYPCALPNTQTAVDRVAARVKQGGHDIPMIVINRRFHRSLRNLFGLYIPLVNRWKVFDNYSTPPVLIARGTRNRK
ncbi:MAG: hypothetical protein LH481_03485 [Burkholderiales bacterium]|nr:hypothetical protein [Burkholderiales bacterium]